MRGRLLLWIASSGVALASGCRRDFDLFEVVGEGGSAGEGGADPGTPLVSPAGPSKLAGRYFHSCAVVEGQPYCWGRGSEGAFVGTTSDQPLPLPVDVGREVVSVRTGRAFSCALDAAGALFCWGANESGQLGQGHSESVAEVVPVRLPEPLLDFDLGFAFACAIGKSGAVYVWGENAEHQLGLGDPPGEGRDRATPTLLEEARGAVRCATGEAHACALAASGGLTCWGRNGFGESGQPPAAAPQVRAPAAPPGARAYRSVAPGQFSTCAVAVEGGLYCWGSDRYGQSLSGGADEPTLVEARSDIVDVQSNAFATCFSTDASELHCFGFNEWGEFGLGDELPRAAPTLVSGASIVERFVVAWQHLCIEESSGLVRCSGRGAEGQLGDGSLGLSSDFRAVDFP